MDVIILAINKLSFTKLNTNKKLCHSHYDSLQYSQLPQFRNDIWLTNVYAFNKFRYSGKLSFRDYRNCDRIDFIDFREEFLPGLFDKTKLCSNCGALLFPGEHKGFFCGNLEEIHDHVDLGDFPNMTRTLNAMVRPLTQSGAIYMQKLALRRLYKFVEWTMVWIQSNNFCRQFMLLPLQANT